MMYLSCQNSKMHLHPWESFFDLASQSYAKYISHNDSTIVPSPETHLSKTSWRISTPLRFRATFRWPKIAVNVLQFCFWNGQLRL